MSRAALALVPDDASVTATYQLLPHLAHREQIYDWPNPFVPAYWGNDDCYRLPSPTAIDYVVVDRNAAGVGDAGTVELALAAPGFNSDATRILHRDGALYVIGNTDPGGANGHSSDIVVAKRVGTSPAVDVTPQDTACAGKRR